MATPDVNTRRADAQIAMAFRVHQHHKDKAFDRFLKQDTSTAKGREIKSYYLRISAFNGLIEEAFQDLWAALNEWATEHSLPSANPGGLFQGTLSGKDRLQSMMFTTNVLNTAASNNYDVQLEAWADTEGNKYQRFMFMLDRLDDFTLGVARRLWQFEIEWDNQGSNKRETDAVAIFKAHKDAFMTAQYYLSNLAIKIRNEKGNATSVNRPRLRKWYVKKDAPPVDFNMYSINRGTTTTVNPSGGAVLGNGPDPVEWDPDIDTARDEPDMVTDAT